MQFFKRHAYTTWLRTTGRGPQIAFLEDIRGKQYISRLETENWHKRKVIDVLRFAYSHVPYYRSLLHGLKIGLTEIDSTPYEVLAQLPLLDKHTLRERFEDLKSDDLNRRKWHVNTSGGSTGEPARFVQDAFCHHAGMAGKALFDEWSSYTAGQRKVVLWGSERDLLVGKETWRSRVGLWLRNEYPLNTFRMAESNLHEFVDAINHAKPVQILAYVESAYEIARFIEREGLVVHSPETVLVSAGTLYPHMRETIERVFAAPVFNRYGSREVGDIACECDRHLGMHVNVFTHHVEILGEDGAQCAADEVGDIVVTSLSNFAMPLLRYRIGDLGTWSGSACDCGRNWPLLKEVAGRKNSIIRTKNGSYDSVALSTLMYFRDIEKTQPFRSFDRYQLLQKAMDHFIFKVVLNSEEIWREEEPIILRKLRAVLGDGVLLEIERVEEIARSPSGKFVYIWSEIG